MAASPPISSLAFTIQRCERKGSGATSIVSRPSRLGTSTNAVSGAANNGSRHDGAQLEQRLHGLQATIAVVVAGDHDDPSACRGEVEQRSIDDLLRLGRGRGAVEHVAAHQHGVDLVFGRDGGDLGEHVPVLVGPRLPADRAPDVPVAGVEELHRGNPSSGLSGSAASSSAGLTPASDDRVAHAGNGNSSTIGTGNIGWLMIIVPGLMIVARCRCVGGKKP